MFSSKIAEMRPRQGERSNPLIVGRCSVLADPSGNPPSGIRGRSPSMAHRRRMLALDPVHSGAPSAWRASGGQFHPLVVNGWGVVGRAAGRISGIARLSQ